MKVLVLVALIALTTASYFQAEQTYQNIKTIEEEEENYGEKTNEPSEYSYSNDNDYSSDSSDSSDSESESEDEERRRPQMRGSHNGGDRPQRGEGKPQRGEGRPQRGEGRPQREEGHKCQGKEQRGDKKDHKRPEPHPEPRPQPDEFDIQAFETLKGIAHGILDEWKVAEDPALKNEIRAALIANLENLLPVAEIPDPEMAPVPVAAPEVINFEQVRVIEEGGN